METNTKHRVMCIAHRMNKQASLRLSPEGKREQPNTLPFRGMGVGFGMYLSLAWYFERLRKALSKGVVRFSYFKADGSIREAVGTTCNLLIPTEKRPKGTSQARENLISISYFDFERQDWRGFQMAKFIGFVDVWQLVRMDGHALNDLKPAKTQYLA